MAGIDSKLIEVELDSAPGLHAFTIVGLPDKAVQESKERIASAIRTNSLLPPSAKHKKFIVNLAPADIRKEGPSYDLPIAVGYLLETDQIKFEPRGKLFLGELALDGKLKPVNGVLSAALLAKNNGFKEIFVPEANAGEASLVEGLKVFAVSSISHLIGHLNGISPIRPTTPRPYAQNDGNGEAFRFIKGQEAAKRALTIAAAGGHNILMAGPPGAGKTLLAKALTDLMPPLAFPEAIEVTKVYSAVGQANQAVLASKRPFRSPHHTTSAPAMVGGGTNPRPGEISLAHRGVLFLDELPEFPRSVLESLREPLQEGVITVSRASGSLVLPAKFTLVAAMNPCPCGNYGSSKECVCLPGSVLRYRKRVSGPLLDRIDIRINVPRETTAALQPMPSDKFQELRGRVVSARKSQEKRFKTAGIFCNAEMGYKTVDSWCKLSSEAERFLEKAVQSKGLSLRSYHKIKKLGRTIADLESSELIQQAHIAEAVSLNAGDRILGELA